MRYDSFEKNTILIDGYRVSIFTKNQLSLLQESPEIPAAVLSLVQQAQTLDFLEFGLVEVPRFLNQFRQIPVLLFRFPTGFEPVHYKSQWMCRECGCHTGPVILHQIYADSFYLKEELPPVIKRVNSLFPPSRCPSCGCPLQGNPILLPQLSENNT